MRNKEQGKDPYLGEFDSPTTSFLAPSEEPLMVEENPIAKKTSIAEKPVKTPTEPSTVRRSCPLSLEEQQPTRVAVTRDRTRQAAEKFQNKDE